jgi:hypothetical protein
MFPNSNPNQPTYPAYQAPSPQNKKIIIFGGLGGIFLVIILALLLFSGGGKNSASLQTKLNSLLTDQSQLIIIASQYQNNISSSDLLNDSATAQITWQSTLNDTTPFYNSLSKKPFVQVSSLDSKTKQTLDSAQQAGNLDSALAASLVAQTQQIKSEVSSISKEKPSAKLLAQLQDINSLADNTIKQISPFTNQ